MNWTRKSEVSYNCRHVHLTTTTAPKSDDGYTDRVLCRFLHSSINTTSAQHLIVSLNQSLSCNCIHASISYCCNQSTSCLGQRSILILLISHSRNITKSIVSYVYLGHHLATYSPLNLIKQSFVTLFSNGYYCSPESYQAGDTITDNTTPYQRRIVFTTNLIMHQSMSW